MRAETISEQLFFTTAWLEATGSEGCSVGTGFIVAVETSGGTVHSLVTNKHVLSGASALRVRLVKSAGDAPALGEASEITVTNYSENAWVGHPDPGIDVAVAPLAPVIRETVRLGAPPFFRSLSPDLFASGELLQQLDAIEEVTFVGYPNGLFDTSNYLPIARRGISATPLDVNYQGKPAFLIDASVFPGSSGSPVFLLDRGMYQSRDGGTVVGARFACLGIVSAVHIRTVSGTIVETTSRFGVQVQEPIDLGIVYRASTIDDCIDRLLATAGLNRVAGPPSTPPGEISEVDEQVSDDLQSRDG